MGEVVPLRPARKSEKAQDVDEVLVWHCGQCDSDKFHVVQGVHEPFAALVCSGCHGPVDTVILEG